MVRLGGAQWSVCASRTGVGDLIWASNHHYQTARSSMVRTIFGGLLEFQDHKDTNQHF